VFFCAGTILRSDKLSLRDAGVDREKSPDAPTSSCRCGRRIWTTSAPIFVATCSDSPMRRYISDSSSIGDLSFVSSVVCVGDDSSDDGWFGGFACSGSRSSRSW